MNMYDLVAHGMTVFAVIIVAVAIVLAIYRFTVVDSVDTKYWKEIHDLEKRLEKLEDVICERKRK